MAAPEEEKEAPSADALELSATWISVALIAALIAFLVWDAAQPSRPPQFTVVMDSVSRRGANVYVPISVKNTGDEAARMVEVRVVAVGIEAAEAHFTIDWVPGRSTRRGVAVFPDSLRGGTFKAAVEGYAAP